MVVRIKHTWTRFVQSPVRQLGLVALALALVLGLLGYRSIEDFLANVSTELASIAITVLIIDSLNERRSIEQQKADLILQMSSPDNAFAQEAVRKLRARGWLKDGALYGADLRWANLRKGELWSANLQGVNLDQADLTGARLEKADLRGARNVTDEQLEYVCGSGWATGRPTAMPALPQSLALSS